MLKILLLALQLFTSHWNIENPDNFIDGVAYSLAEADCTLNPTSHYSCIMACNASVQWLSYADTIESMPACLTILRAGDIL